MGKSGRFLREYGALVALVVLVVLNAAAQPDVFLRPENLRNLVNQNAVVGIVAVGMTLVIIAGGIDLSVGSLCALAGAVGLHTVARAIPMGEVSAVALGVVACVGVGLACGLVNGALVAYGRVTAFIATLVGLVGYRSLALVSADGGEVRSASATVLPAIGQGGIPLPIATASGRPLELTWNILAFVAVAVAGHVLLTRTTFGRNVVAVGANEQAAFLAGIAVQRVKLATYALCGALSGLAAVGLAGRMNSVSSSQTGVLYELDAIAAVAIGGTSMAGGHGRVWGTVVGVLILGVISNMLVANDVSPYWQGLVKGVVILLAVLLQRSRA